MSNNSEARLSVLLEEFRWHYNECLKYIDSLNHFSNLQLVALGAVVAGLTALISQSRTEPTTILFAILLVPFPFNFLAWSYEHCHMMIAANARYIAHNLKPKIELATDSYELFEWEAFLQNDTFKFKDKYFLSSSIGYASAFFLAITVTVCSLLGALVLFIYSLVPLSHSWWAAAISIADLILMILTIRNHWLVSTYFKSTVITPNKALQRDALQAACP